MTWFIVDVKLTLFSPNFHFQVFSKKKKKKWKGLHGKIALFPLGFEVFSKKMEKSSRQNCFISFGF